MLFPFANIFSRHQYYRQRKFSHQDSVEAKKVTEENGDAGNRKISAPEDATLEVNIIANCVVYLFLCKQI